MPCHPQTQVCPCEQSQRHERESMRGRQAAADSCRKPNRDGWVLATDTQVPGQRDPLPSPYSNGTVPEAACPEIPEPARREERRLGGRHPEERGSKALEGGQGPEGGDAAPPALGPAPPGARGGMNWVGVECVCKPTPFLTRRSLPTARGKCGREAGSLGAPTREAVVIRLQKKLKSGLELLSCATEQKPPNLKSRLQQRLLLLLSCAGYTESQPSLSRGQRHTGREGGRRSGTSGEKQEAGWAQGALPRRGRDALEGGAETTAATRASWALEGPRPWLQETAAGGGRAWAPRSDGGGEGRKQHGGRPTRERRKLGHTRAECDAHSRHPKGLQQ